MKAVMLSIQPKWCEKIASGEKTVEVRKTRPKIETPILCYIYCTRQKVNGEILLTHNKKVEGRNRGFREQGDIPLAGKVIGEFVCDRVGEIGFSPEMHGKYICKDKSFVKQSCIPFEQMFDYLEDGYGYGWHISDLVIYDKPKELSEFHHYCGDDPKCDGCKYLYSESNESVGLYEECCSPVEGCKPLTRPPQSWCYVEVQE